MSSHRIGLCLTLLLLLASSGCDSRPSRVPVSGKVLIDGEPLKYGTVVFVPEAGRQSTGPIDENGAFALTCYEPNDGALVGKHRVEILASEAISNTSLKWHAPKKYSDRKTSELVQQVDGSMDSVEITLTWKGSPPEKPYVERTDTSDGEDAFSRSRAKK